MIGAVQRAGVDQEGEPVATTTPSDDWSDLNRRYLAAEVVAVRACLERRVAELQGRTDFDLTEFDTSAARDILRDMVEPPALERIREVFQLSSFERALLLLCAAAELDGSISTLCGTAQGDSRRSFPTFSLALAALPFPHWSAIAPGSPLRRWRLIDLGSGPSLTASQLRLDERILHELTGVRQIDERLASVVERSDFTGDLAPSHWSLAQRIATAWSGMGRAALLPFVQLCGPDVASKRAIAAVVCRALGLRLMVMQAEVVPGSPSDLDPLVRLWDREASLTGSALLLDCEEVDASDAARSSAVARLIDRVQGPLLVACRDRRRVRQRPALTYDVAKPIHVEQHAVWRQALGPLSSRLNGDAEALSAQFDLSTATILAAAAEARGQLTGDDTEDIATMIWDACRVQARPRLDDLAQRIDSSSGWDDLVLPEPQKHTLREMAMHVRHRTTVYDQWGFAGRGARGLGISALFAGASGTGKTMAAEVLARELRLDLYRVDLSSVVSKYIGETEKNLRRVFDAAEDGGAILLFDEADALFGKRSEVKDSHDRYANIEVGYLLQRMESFRGLAILTTNLKSSLDTAFLRRIRFVVQFPFPDVSQRAEIWRRVFPEATPTHGLDSEKLARLNVAGGNIRNIALGAAFLAADRREPVGMIHILRAAEAEYAKLEKPLTEAEVGAWDVGFFSDSRERV